MQTHTHNKNSTFILEMNFGFRLLAICTIACICCTKACLSGYRTSRIQLYVDGTSYDTTDLCDPITAASCTYDDRDGYKRISMTAADDEIENAFQELLTIIENAAPCNGVKPLGTLTADATKRFVWGDFCGHREVRAAAELPRLSRQPRLSSASGGTQDMCAEASTHERAVPHRRQGHRGLLRKRRRQPDGVHL